MADETKRIIFELEVNNSKLGVELATINDRLAKAKQLQKDWNKELSGLKEGTKEYSNVAKLAADANATVRQLNAEAKKTTEALKLSEAVPGSYNALKSEIKLTREALDKLVIGSDAYNKTEGELNTLLTKEIEIRTAQKSLFQERIKGAINESDVTKTLTQQYKELQIQLQGLADQGKVGTDEFNNLAKAAGQVKDKINEGKEAAKAFSTGSNLEQFGNVLGNIKGDLTNLDFGGAAEKAKQLADVSKSMTFASAVESAKALGATLLETGKALLNNPLFIIGAAIAAVGVALYQLNKRAEENKKAFDESSKSLKEYEKGLRNLEVAANDSADALAASQGKITDAELARNKRKRQLDADLIKAQEELDEQLQATRDKKELTDESRDILQRRAIADNIEKVKLLNKIAADDLAKIDLDATIAKIDADNDRFEKQQEEDKKRHEKEVADAEKLSKEKLEAVKKSEQLALEELNATREKQKEEQDKKDQEEADKFIAKLEKDLETAKTQAEAKKAIAQGLADAEVSIEQSKLQALGVVATLLKNSAKDNAELQKTFFAFEKIVAVAQIVKNLQLEKSGIAASNSLLGIAGAPLTLAQNQAANLRAAISIGTILAQAIPQFYEGGFTERGNPREATRNLGPRPYIYHKNEYIVPDKVLSTPEGARHVMELETMRKGSGNRYSNLTGYADGGFADRALTDSVNAEIQTRESMAEVVSQQKIFVAVEDINTGQRSVQVTESRNTI